MLRSGTSRRRETRRSVLRPDPLWRIWWQRIRHREAIWACFFGACFALAGGLVTWLSYGHLGYHQGQVVQQSVLARVQFRAVDEAETSKRRSEARDREPNIYNANISYLKQIRENLISLAALAADKSIQSVEQIPQERREQAEFTAATLEELRTFIKDDKPTDAWLKLSEEFLSGLQEVAIVSPERGKEERDSPGTKAYRIVIMQPGSGETERSDKAILSTSDDTQILQARISVIARKFPPAIRKSVVALVMQDLRPTYLLDKDQSQRRKDQAAENEPPVEMNYEPDDVLVSAGTALSKLNLDVLRKERAEYRTSLGPMKLTVRTAGRVGIVVLMALGIWGYIVTYNRTLAAKPARGLALTLLLVLCHALAVTLTVYEPDWVYGNLTFPVVLATMILVIAFDRRFALAMGAMLSFAVMLSLPTQHQRVELTLTMLVGVAVASSLLGEVRTRSKLVLVGIWTGLAMALVTSWMAVATRPMLNPSEWQQLLHDAVLTAVTGFAAGLLAHGMLPLIERLFRVSTAMTLKDLNDASHPLLRRLAQDAPGTYQHSLRIADMGESAADAIGANGLLCRVGAMYHDIGKINKPLYFVENQGGGPNRHDKLSPAMSLLIIVGHVKDGVEMAREYGLPQSLRHFIESHHGTTLVEYFYHAAKRKSDLSDSPAPTEFEFRYPGPKPQTKEAAILMISDGVEGAARTLPETTPARLEQLTHKIANNRLMDGQFDECNLTLQELHKIVESITKTLCAIYHGRVKYPSQREPQAPENERSDEGQRPMASAG